MSTYTDTNYDASHRNLLQHLTDYATSDHTKNAYLTDALRIFSDKVESKTYGLTYKARVIFTILHNRDGAAFEKFYKHLQLSEVLKACEMLDAPRLMRQLERRTENYPNSSKIAMDTNNHRVAYGDVFCVNKQLIGSNISAISLSTSKINLIKKWVKSIPKSKLEYMVMMFNMDGWKDLANLCHFSPSDFQHDWYLDFCYGKPVPEDSVCHAWNTLSYENFVEIYDKYFSPDFTYEVIRTNIDLHQYDVSYGGRLIKREIPPEQDKLRDDIRNAVIAKEGLATVLWYWDELVTPRNIHNVLAKLRESTDVDLSYGKIVDIISKTDDKEVLDILIDISKDKASNYVFPESVCPVAVLCDASSSMEVAIRTSSIITSLLCYLTNASLDVFGSNNLHIDDPPRSAEEAVEFGKTMKTRGCTNCASSIAHYYERRETVQTFIIVTDEEENTQNKGLWFHDVYKKYIDEIYPAKLIFVSFSNPNKDAVMVDRLKRVIDEDRFASLVDVYKFDVRNPDMNRMDVVLRRIAQI